MLSKKTQKGNLENRKITFGLIGLALVLGLVYLAFEFFASKEGKGKFVPTESDLEMPIDVDIPDTDLEKLRGQIPQEALKNWIINITEEETSKDWEKFIAGLGIKFDDPIPESPEGDIEIVHPTPEPPPIYIFTDVMPEYPGGSDAMYTFLAKNIVYPERSRIVGIQGISLIEFVVEKDGSVSNTTVRSSLHPDCDNEAMRVIKMLKFSPGLKDGKPVRVYYVIPVRFVLL